jgi:hypothetical protein
MGHFSQQNFDTLSLLLRVMSTKLIKVSRKHTQLSVKHMHMGSVLSNITSPPPPSLSLSLSPQTGSSLVDSDSHHFPFHTVHQQTTSATPISSSPHNRSLPQPIGHPPERTGSSLSEGAFQRAPGAEVKSRSFEEEGQVSMSV